MIIEAKNEFVVLTAEEGKIFKSKVSGDILTKRFILVVMILLIIMKK